VYKSSNNINIWNNFFSTYNQPSTLKGYQIVLKRYLNLIYKEKVDPIEYTDKYFREDRDYEKDVLTYFRTRAKFAPVSFKREISVIRMFLDEGRVTLRKSFWKKIRRLKKGSRAISQDRIPSRMELKRILLHMPIHGKALFLLLVSSGMRLGEASRLLF
jgi:integrase